MGNPGSSKSSSSFIEFDLHKQDVKMGVEDDMPTIIFSEKVKGTLTRSMNPSVTVKLLGKAIRYKALQNRIISLWKPLGDFQIIDLENGYFLINLENQEDYINVLTKGPWTILGH